MASPFSKPAHEPALARSARRARGVFYTPVEIAEWLVEQTYGPLLTKWNGVEPPPRFLDPACGAGVFLQAAIKSLRMRCVQFGFCREQQQQAVGEAIFGIDIDAATIQTARVQTGLPTSNLRCADFLAAERIGSFAAIVGNPPYVSIRELVKNAGAEKVASLRERYQSARGNFDLYVPFCERALQLLAPGGRLGLIVPNKWATLDYARALREMLLKETTLERIVDLSSLRVFPQAGTYPQLIVLQKQPAGQRHCLQLSHSIAPSIDSKTILQRDLDPRGLVLGDEIRVEARVATVPLSAVATLHSGASGYSASKLAAAINERTDIASGQAAAEFIVSGNIDRYAIEPGDVRFLNQVWRRPALPLDSGCLTAAKRTLYTSPKIVISGMSRRLEAAYDETGCALGVQVYAASSLQMDPWYLLGVLNSKLLTYLFRERFAAKRLAGNYFSLNKGQLAQLPIRRVDPSDRAALEMVVQIRSWAGQLQKNYVAAVDQQLDELVYRLYEVTTAERERIEAAFEERSINQSIHHAA